MDIQQDTGLSEIQMQEASIADRCPLEQTWDEADEDALVARIRGISARASMDTASEIELRRQDEALLRESEAVVARALHIPGERKMLMKLDESSTQLYVSLMLDMLRGYQREGKVRDTLVKPRLLCACLLC